MQSKRGVTVSLIIPVYNVSSYIDRCLNSVIQQTYTDIECIIVDDATKDDSIEKCERLIGEYDGSILFRIIHHEENRGLSAARNTGTDAATGDYLYYLDSDDYISPDCIERLMAPVAEDETIEMVQGNYMLLCDGSEEVIYKDAPVRISNNNEARVQFLKYHHIYISVWNKLLKRSFVLENRLYCKEGLINEDHLWVFYLAKYLKNAVLCDAVTYYYFIRSSSIVTSTDMRKMGENFRMIFDDILHHLTTGDERFELKGYLYTFCNRYLTYVKEVPAFRGTAKLYMENARQHGCWFAWGMLGVLSGISRIGNPLRLLDCLNSIRWNVKRMVWKSTSTI